MRKRKICNNNQVTSQFNGIRFNLVAIQTLFIGASKSISKKNYEKKNSSRESYQVWIIIGFLELVGRLFPAFKSSKLILIRRSTREKIKTQISVINSFNQCLICKRIVSVQIQQESAILHAKPAVPHLVFTSIVPILTYSRRYFRNSRVGAQFIWKLWNKMAAKSELRGG